jgi:type IV secretion system protein VirB6
MGIFASFGDTFTQASNTLVNSSVSHIIAQITPVVTTGVIIYFMITGYMVLAGRISEPIGDVCIKGFKIALIASLTLNAGNINTYIFGIVNGIETMFITAITGDSTTDAFQSLDNIFDKSIDAAAQSVAAATEKNFMDMGQIFALYATTAIITISSIAMTIVGGAILLLSKIALSVLFGVAPFFLIGLMFPVTARWADAWLNQALNYTLVSAIVIFILSLATIFYEKSMNLILLEVSGGTCFPVAPLFELLIISILTGYVLTQAPSIASGLAGGAASAGASLTGMVARSKQVGNWIDSAHGAMSQDAIRVKQIAARGSEVTGVSRVVRRIKNRRGNKITAY